MSKYPGNIQTHLDALLAVSAGDRETFKRVRDQIPTAALVRVAAAYADAMRGYAPTISGPNDAERVMWHVFSLGRRS